MPAVDDSSNTAQAQETSPREGHRFLRHFCISGMVLCALYSIQGFLPPVYQARLLVEPAMGIDLGWLLPTAMAGLVFSWLLRRRRLFIWRRLLGAGAALQASYFGWLVVQRQEPAIPLVCGAWTGVVISQCFCANSQKTYNLLQWVCLILLCVGGWEQMTDIYPQLLALSLALLIFSSMAARLSPVGVADMYVDSGSPGLERTLFLGAFVLLAIGVVSIPVYFALPRPTPEQRDIIKALLPAKSPALAVWDRQSEDEIRGFSANLLRPRRMRLSQLQPPLFTNKALFVIEGPHPVTLRAEILDTYNGRTWSLRKQKRITPLFAVNRDEARRIVFNRTDGSAMVHVDAQEYLVHVLGYQGANLVRPRGTLEAMVPGRRLYRDGLGNIYVQPRLGPPLTYSLKAPAPDFRRRNWYDDEPVDRAYLQLPKVPARLRALVLDLTRRCTGDTARIHALVAYLHAHCRYRLAEHRIPFDRDATDHFIFDKKEGWCVHFASALAVLCRLAKIPSRVVLGFGPGERDTLTGTFRVTDRNAHAWIEARPDGHDWVEFDPTPADDSPLQAPQQRETRTLASVGQVADKLAATGLKIRDRYTWLRTELRRRPEWLLCLVPFLATLLWVLYRARTRRQRAHVAGLWREVREGTPRISARAAYMLVSEHLQRRGFGDREHTTPEEYLARLREVSSPATNAMAIIIAIYEASAFGPQVSLRWDRAQLIRCCETVLGRVKARGA